MLEGASFKIWAYDGMNTPYKLKFPDGNDSLKASEISLDQNTIKYYPNPTKSDVTVDLDKSYRSIEVHITAADGKIVKKQTFSNSSKIKVQLPHTSGVYYITLMYDNKSSTHKIIKE